LESSSIVANGFDRVSKTLPARMKFFSQLTNCHPIEEAPELSRSLP
jgi:hypothetical protein